MNYLKMDIEEIRKSKNAEEVISLLIEGIDGNIEWETKTKAELIRIAAEKYEQAGYPIKEIKELIIERLGNRVKPHYVGQCLDERFKKITKVVAGKKGGEAKANKQAAMTNAGVSGSSTVLEPPQHQSDGDDAYHEGEDPATKPVREQLPDIQPQLESESVGDFGLVQDDSESKNDVVMGGYSDQYVKALEEQIQALKGELAYKDCLATLKVVKVDKVTENRIYNASKAAKTHIYLIVDIRSNEIREIFTDTEYQKQIKQKSKNKKE